MTLHTAFSPGIRGQLSYPSPAAVIVASRAESFGRVPLDAVTAGASQSSPRPAAVSANSRRQGRPAERGPARATYVPREPGPSGSNRR